MKRRTDYRSQLRRALAPLRIGVGAGEVATAEAFRPPAPAFYTSPAYGTAIVLVAWLTSHRIVVRNPKGSERYKHFGPVESFYRSALTCDRAAKVPFLKRNEPAQGQWWASVHGLERIPTNFEVARAAEGDAPPHAGWRLISDAEAAEWVRETKSQPKRGAETDTERAHREAHERKRAELHAAKLSDLEAKVTTWKRKHALATTKLATYTKALERWKKRTP